MQRISRGRLISVAAVCMVTSAVFTAGALGYSVPQMQPEARQEPVASPSPVDSRPLVVPPDSGAKMSVRKQVLMAQAVTQPATAPSATGPGQSLSGVVTDPSGAVVPNAQVALKGENSAVISLTDALGRFQFQNIDGGVYSLQVKAQGFKVVSQTDLRISAGDAHDIGNMPLPIGSMSESISVTGSRSAPVATATPVGNPLGPMTSIAPTSGPPVGIPLDQKQPRSFPSSANGGQRPTKVGGMVQPANLINPIRPAYPPELQQQGVQGTVRMEAVVLKDGRVNELKSVGSPDPGLTRSAMEAVWQWRYTPTMLNGEPVETLTVIDVNFSLKD